MTTVLDILQGYLYSIGFYDDKVARLDGKTSYEERLLELTKFESDECQIFLLSTRAGGMGLNLQLADTIILYDSDWNPQADLQVLKISFENHMKSDLR